MKIKQNFQRLQLEKIVENVTHLRFYAERNSKLETK